MKRRVLLLDQGETMGGAERFLVDFCNALTPTERRRVNPAVVGAKVSTYGEMLADNIETIPFVFPGLKGNIFQKPFIIFALLFAGRRLAKLIKKEGSKVVFSNTPRTHLVMWVATVFFGAKTSWHVMIHDFTTPCFLLRSIGKHAKTVIVNSMGTRADTREKMRLQDHKKVRIIENGVDIPKIPDPVYSDRIKDILVIGRIDRRKGQNYSLEVARMMKDRIPSLHFWVVGAPFKEDPETEKYYKELKDYAKRYDLTNVTFVGEVKDAFEVYAQSDLVLFTPIDPEPFGRVTIEGLAMGKLVLAFDETGPREVLEQFIHFCGKNDIELQREHILTKSCDATALAKQVEYWYQHVDEMKVYMKHARPFIEEVFPLEYTKKRMVELFLD